MRRWGILISVFYACVVLFLLLPLLIWLASGDAWQWNVWSAFDWDINLLVWIAILVAGQALLLLVSVDDSFKRLKPRVRVAVSIATVSVMVSLLTVAASWSLAVAVWGDDATAVTTTRLFWGALVAMWLVWAAIFGMHERGFSARLDRVVVSLLKGSILELLIVVPCHVVVRQREDCSAPAVTGFGIATGIAVMLLSFGPSVLFLYRQRLKSYEKRGTSTGA